MKVNKKFIKKINNGNRNAEKELFDYTKSKIKFFLENQYPTNSIEDDTSDIVIKIFEKINLFDGRKSKYHTWITNVAKNHMIDKSRVYANNVFFVSTSGAATTDTLDIINNGSNISVTLKSNNDFISAYENKDTVLALSNTINSSDLSLLKMKYSSGYNYEEIGKEVNMDKTKVSNRVNYIKRKIKKGN